MNHRRKNKNTSRLSVVISFVFHGLIIVVLFVMAAREGMLGKQLKKIAVTMVPKEKPPEKPKEEKPPEPKPEIEPQKMEEPKVPVAQPEIAKTVSAPPPAGLAAPPAVAPPAHAIPAFDFEGGKAVESSSDPNVLYKGFVEYTLRSRWVRPDGVDDANFVAEAEVTLDRTGQLQGSSWRKGSGHAAWDNSVKKVLSDTSSIGRAPPKGFPETVLVRFDVLASTEVEIE